VFSEKWRRNLFLTILLLLLSFEARAFGEKLIILHTNDTHSHLVPFDLPEFGKQIGGIARIDAYIRKTRAENPNVLVLDAGDILQGTAFYSFFKGEAEIKAFSLCGYDTACLGNHELDDGLGNLLNKLAMGNFPMLCANVVYYDSKKPVFPAYKIFQCGTIKVGVIGLIDHSAWDVVTLKWKANLTMTDSEECLKKIIAEINEKTDLIIVLSHCGFQRDVELAERVDGIDVIIGGHTNTFVEKPKVVKKHPKLVKKGGAAGLGGTLVLQAFKWGVFIGRLELEFDSEKKLVSYEGRLDPIDGTIPIAHDSQVNRLVSAFEERIKTATSQVIGNCPKKLDFSENLKHKQDLPLGTLVGEALREFTGADFAILNAGSIRDSLSSGPVTMGMIFTIFPFDNSVVSVKMKGKDIQEALDFIAENFGKITGYQYGGASFTLDLQRKKATDVYIAGAPLDPERIYTVATISYLTEGNQNGNILFKKAWGKSDTGFFVRDVILEYIKKRGEVIAPEGRRIKIVGEK